MSGCIKLSDKKYTKRSSPPYSAASCPIGDLKLGNNGKMYIVTANKNGVHRWVMAPQVKQVQQVKQVSPNHITNVHVVVDEPLIKYYHVKATDWDSFVSRLPQAKLDSANQYTGYTQTDCRYFIHNNTLYFKMICIIELPKTDTKDKKVVTWLQHLHCHEMGHFTKIKKFIQDFFTNLKLPLDKKQISQIINKNIFSNLDHVHKTFDVETEHGCGYDKNCSKISPCL